MDEQMNQGIPEPTPSSPVPEPAYVTFEGDGAPVPVSQYVSYTDTPAPETDASDTPKGEESGRGRLGVASMILGIVSLAGWLLTCGSISLPTAVMAVIFGFVGRVDGRMTGQGRTGIICGIISLGILILLTVLLVAVMVVMLLWAPDAMRDTFFETVMDVAEIYR